LFGRSATEAQRRAALRLGPRASGGRRGWNRDLQFVLPLLRSLPGENRRTQGGRPVGGVDAVLPPALGRQGGEHAVSGLLGDPVSEGWGNRSGLFAGPMEGTRSEAGQAVCRHPGRRRAVSANPVCPSLGIAGPGMGDPFQGQPAGPGGRSRAADEPPRRLSRGRRRKHGLSSMAGRFLK